MSKKPTTTPNDRKAASRLARRIGCAGAHQREDGTWMPCKSADELMEISKAAETRLPKGLKSADEPPPCIGCEQEYKSARERQGDKHRKRWQRFRERGISGIVTLPDGGLTSAPVGEKELNRRQQAVYEGLESVVERLGKFSQDTGADGAHYMGADKNPFIKEGLVCSNCAFWVGPNGCEVVEGKLEPNALCKLWVIDEDRLANVDEKAIKGFDYFARDGDLDGMVQDGSDQERRSRTLSHAVIGRGKKKPTVTRVRLRDLPFPYPTEPTPDVKD